MTQTVLYVVDSLGLSGKTFGLVNLALGLDPKRYRSVVATLTPSQGMLVEKLRAAEIPIVDVPCPDGLSSAVVGKLLRLARDIRPAMVHCYNPRPMLYGGLVAALGARPAIGTLSAFACMSAKRSYTFLPQPLHTRSRKNRVRNYVVGRLMHRLATVSQRGGESFCEDNAIPRHKLRVIGYGVDVDRIERVTPEEVARMNALIGRRPGDIVLGSVGRLVEQKDYPNQLRAFAMAAKHAQLRMVIAGGGPLDGELRELATQLGVADRVCLLGEQRDVWPVLRCLDAFVIASKFEPYGVAILEAMAAGLPIIATDVDELPAILDHGRAGLLVPAERPALLAAALERIATDGELRARLAQDARALARERYSLPAVLTAYQGLYEDVMREHER
jgi:glycosyltransferase involved in cell wall biosynthesis